MNKKDIWWVKYLKDNILKIFGGLGLFSGGILFLMYYLYIGYLPHLENLGNLTYLLFVMSIMGVVLSLVLLSMFITPALFYLHLLNTKTQNHIDKRKFILSLSIMPIILLIFFICSILCPLDIANNIALSISVCIIFVYFCYLHFTRCIGEREKCKYKESMILLSLIGYIPLLLYIIIILSGQSSISTSWGALFALLFFSFMVIGINIYITFEYTVMTLETLGIVSMFLFLIFYTSTYAIVPSAIMHKFHLGDFFAKQIHISQRGCKTFLDQNMSTFKIDKNDDFCKIIGDICVLSNIGTNTLLKLDNNRTIEVLSKDITSMIIDRSDNRRCVAYQPNDKIKENNQSKL